MKNYITTFGLQPVLLPVIHVENENQTLENAHILSQENIKGCFLISMKGMPDDNLLQILNSVKNKYPNLWLGINLLGTPILEVFEKLNDNVDGVWTDNAMIDENVESQIDAQAIDNARKKSEWNGLYFGGVAFKGQTLVTDTSRTAKIASQFMDVVTTSGTRTGIPPELSKIRIMKQAIGATPLAIASGISSENVKEYMEYCSCFLVASSLLKDESEIFDCKKIKSFIEVLSK